MAGKFYIKKKKKGPNMEAHACNPTYLGGRNRRITVQGQLARKKKVGGRQVGSMAQVVECLPSKYKALSSNPSPIKKEKQKGCEGTCL
jgi:hypothetical protein